MSKKPAAFTSKTSAEMYQNLPAVDDEEDVRVPPTPRRAQRMDPSGPFVGELTRARVSSLASNVEMEDVSGSARIANAPALPKHPIFNGSTTKEKREFIKKYNLYYSTLLSYETTYNKPFVMPVSACIDPWVKEHLARFEFGRSAGQISEFEWIEYFRASEKSERTDLAPLDAMMTKLRLDLRLADASSMMTDLVMKIYKNLDDQGLTEYVEKADPKRIVGWMVKALEPAVFKSRIEEKLRLEINKGLKKNPVDARRWIAEDLKNFLEYSTEDWTKQTKKVDPKNPTRDPTKKSKTPTGSSTSATETTDSTPKSDRTPRRFACLKCGSTEHAVRQCPQLKDGEAEKLLADRRKAKEEKPKRNIDFAHQTGAGRTGLVRVTLEDCWDSEALLDSGADCALISRGLLEKLERKAGFLKMKLLNEPERIGTAGPDELVVKRKVCLESVVFHTSAGLLR